MALQTALVVDDSKLARITLQRLLEKHQLRVQTAESAKDALAMIDMQKPDIIFMDHLMPEMDGFEATQEIKRNASTTHIPVIMCTGKEGVDDYDAQARAIGASGTLSKPPQADALAAVLREAGNASTPAPAATAPTPEPAQADIPQPRVFQSELDQASLDKIVAQVQKALDEKLLAPAFAGIESRLKTIESEVVDLASAEAATPPSMSADDIRASVGEQVRSRFSDLFESRIRPQIQTDVDKAMQAVQPVAAAPAKTPEDEAAVTARIVSDVERTLRPMFDSELQAVEERVQTAMDETLSEWRRDLDQQMRVIAEESVLTQKSDGSVDIDAAVARLREEMSDVATASAVGAVDSAIEDRLQTWQSRLDAAIADMQRQLSETSRADTGFSDDVQAQIEALVSEKVAVAGGVLHEQSDAAAAQSSSGGSGMLLGIAGIVIATIALVKSFGVF
ncbi:response regulator [Allohahella marinimesophila]|uniref:Response regulatory domain-containing protein n=1 Tax=Allohahella marinimesophila TaxID=1054972 RepID=A0ABP7NS74_9GAMM